MAPQRRQTLLWCVGLLACAATVTSVTWFTALVTAQHREGALPDSILHTRHSLLAQDQGSESVGKTTPKTVQSVTIAKSSQDSGKSAQSITAALEKKLTEELVSESSLGFQKTIEQKNEKTECNISPNTDFQGGDALVWGSINKKDSAQACCASCKSHKPGKDNKITKPCKYWVWCGDKEKCGPDYRDCWLKSQVQMKAVAPIRGAEIPFTAGILPEFDPANEDQGLEETGDRRYHVVVTAQGSATHWQARVAYYWYRKIQKQCQDTQKRCDMGGWTRLLHGGEPDDLMKEIPTVVVRPLEDRDHKGYVVLNRPWAFVQWLRNSTITEKYLLMSEPDHLWMKPMPNLMRGENGAAFPFFYIAPSEPKNSGFVQRFTGPLTQEQLESIPPIGNAPTMLAYSDMKKIGEEWMHTAHAIFDDQQVYKEWNWVMEMYAFAISTFKVGVGPFKLHWRMICQPPYDVEAPDTPDHYLMHYTYGIDYHLDGRPMFGKQGEWRFDKRTYAQNPIPRNLSLPPETIKNGYVHRLLRMFNEATAMIPGWDEYAKTGVATQYWDGKTFQT